MGDWDKPPRSHDDDPDEISYGDFPDAGGDLWVDDEENAIDLDALDADVLAEVETVDTGDALREDLFAAIADLDDEADAESPPQARPAPAASEPDAPAAERSPQPALPVEDRALGPEAAASPASAPAVDEAPPNAAPAAPGDLRAAMSDDTPGEGARVLPEWIYRIVLTLPLELVEQIEELRAEAGIEAAPPPGIDLAPVFRTGEPGEVEAALDDWAQAHLPFELEIAGVLTNVIGSQQYVAALAVEPDDALDEPYDDLMFDLDGLVTPLEDDDVRLARIVVGSAVPAHAYPRLVARLQREIDLMAWRAESVMLIRREAGADLAEWQVVALFA